jgi:hypothetical protein
MGKFLSYLNQCSCKTFIAVGRIIPLVIGINLSCCPSAVLWAVVTIYIYSVYVEARSSDLTVSL